MKHWAQSQPPGHGWGTVSQKRHLLSYKDCSNGDLSESGALLKKYQDMQIQPQPMTKECVARSDLLMQPATWRADYRWKILWYVKQLSRHFVPLSSSKRSNLESQFFYGNLMTMDEKKVTSSTAISAAPEMMVGDVEPQGYDAKATKRLLRNLDWHIIPFMSLIYLYVRNIASVLAHMNSELPLGCASSIEPTLEMLGLII